tara:strand:+ start:85 stop:195 length:111 start_codon:yes stop_codon:yes gene_type:complete
MNISTNEQIKTDDICDNHIIISFETPMFANAFDTLI